MSTDLPFVDNGDLAIWDTPLHPPIECADFKNGSGEVVIYYPDEETSDAFVVSDTFADTYNCR